MPCGCCQNGARRASRFRQKNPYLECGMKQQHTKLYNLSLLPMHQARKKTVRTARLKFGTLIFSRGPTLHMH